MRANSAPVTSPQQAPHDSLRDVVRRHLDTPWRAPPHAPSQRAVTCVLDRIDAGSRPLVLDSGCGTGASTARLARLFPESVVLGVDQSEVRLPEGAESGVAIAPNAWLIRARAETLWLALAERGLRADLHVLLYPNPWPKPHHLKRRWHGHPVWPTMLAVSDALCLVTNWQVYAAEFAIALECSGWVAETSTQTSRDDPRSPFEAKYLASGHALFEVTATRSRSG